MKIVILELALKLWYIIIYSDQKRGILYVDLAVFELVSTLIPKYEKKGYTKKYIKSKNADSQQA